MSRMYGLRKALSVLAQKAALIPGVTLPAGVGWGMQYTASAPQQPDDVSRYRELYLDVSYVRSGVNHIAEQSVQGGPWLTAMTLGEPGREIPTTEFLKSFRPLATAPRETVVDWLINLATYNVIDGELFLRRVPTMAGLCFEALDPACIHDVVSGEAITGHRMTGRMPMEWAVDDRNYLHVFDVLYPGQTRGISLLRSALAPALDLLAANRAIASAMQEYGQLRGYWELSPDDIRQFKAPVIGETEPEREAREAFNTALYHSKFTAPPGGSATVGQGTGYRPINRGGDTFVSTYRDYVGIAVSRISRSLSVPEYVVSGSVSETNYSALKISRTEAEFRYRATQRMLESVLQWMWGHYAAYMNYPMSKLTEIRWPPQPPLDLQKEVYAIAAGARDRVVSHQTGAEWLGLHWPTELERMAEEQAEFERRGIPMNTPAYPAAPEDQVMAP